MGYTAAQARWVWAALAAAWASALWGISHLGDGPESGCGPSGAMCE